MGFIAAVIGLVIFLIVADKITNKIFAVEKEKLAETSGRRINHWGQAILFIFFLVLLWFMIDSSDILRMFYIIIFLALSFGYQAVMEFIFIKESRQYISTTILVIFLVILSSFGYLYFIK